MSDEAVDWVARAGTRAKGKRPEFFDDSAVDRLTSLAMALMAEVSVLRERLDTVERLLEMKGTIRREDIATYVPDKAAGDERGLATRAYVARVMRGFQQEVEALVANDPPIEDVVARLAKE